MIYCTFTETMLTEIHINIINAIMPPLNSTVRACRPIFPPIYPFCVIPVYCIHTYIDCYSHLIYREDVCSLLWLLITIRVLIHYGYMEEKGVGWIYHLAGQGWILPLSWPPSRTVTTNLASLTNPHGLGIHTRIVVYIHIQRYEWKVWPKRLQYIVLPREA